MPGGVLPWQVHQFAGHKEGRMPKYALGMGLLAIGSYWWWSSSQKDIKTRQAEATAKFGAHGEKAQYGRDFSESKGDRFPGIPGTDTNAAGGHAGGAKA